METGEQEGREMGTDGHHWTESRDLELDLDLDLELDETSLYETGKDRQDRTGKGGEDWERDCNIKPTACSRCNSGGPRPGSTLGRMAWDGVCGTWTNAWRRREERTLVRGVPPPGPSVVCLSCCLAACLSPTRAWLSRNWGRSEGFARWGQLK